VGDVFDATLSKHQEIREISKAFLQVSCVAHKFASFVDLVTIDIAASW